MHLNTNDAFVAVVTLLMASWVYRDVAGALRGRSKESLVLGRELGKIGLMLSSVNFLYQAVGAHHWSVALRFSVFQALALYYAWNTLRGRITVRQPRSQ